MLHREEEAMRHRGRDSTITNIIRSWSISTNNDVNITGGFIELASRDNSSITM